MSEFKVRVQDLYSVMDSAEGLETILLQASESVNAVKRNLRVQIRQRERIDSRLTAASRQLEAQRLALGRVVGTGRRAARLYEDTERRLLNMKARRQQGGESPWELFELDNLFSMDNLKDLIGETGVLGSILNMGLSGGSMDWLGLGGDVAGLVGNLAELAGESDIDWKELVSRAAQAFTSSGDAAGLAGNLAELAGETGIDWKDLVGWTARSSTPGGFGEALKEAVGEYKIGSGQPAGENIAAGAKWAGDLFTVAEHTVSNWKEYGGDLTNLGFYAETILESGLEIGAGMLVGAAVAAFTPVGWTALAVGGATVAATAAVNWVGDLASKFICGNDEGWIENLSDGIIDAGKKIGEGMQKIGESMQKIGEGAKRAADSVADWWNGLFS